MSQTTNKTTNRILAVLRRWIVIVSVSLFITACGGGGEDDGGIIGTGIRLDGTASSQRAYASNDIEIKARSGERSTASLNNNGRFSTEMVEGEGPFLMRADLGNGEYQYSVAHDDGTGQIRQNIHSYTDAAIRNWFATNSADIDAAFAGGQAIGTLPSDEQISDILSSLYAIVAAVLGEYNLAGADLAVDSFDANGTGIDLYLDSNPVLVNNGSITIIISDQITQTLTEATSNVPIDTDFTAVDNEVPSAPTAIRALPAAINEIVVVWEAASDNIGVTTYEIYRDGVLIADTPFPVYTDSNLMTGVDYRYTVVAIDASGNQSATSNIAISQTLAAMDTQAPPAPQALAITASNNNVQLTWSQTDIGDVAAFNVSRAIGTGVTSTIANVTATFMTDTNVMSGTEYCYQVSAVDASGNESGATDKVCAVTPGTAVSMPDNGDAGGLSAPLVDVTNLICTQTLDRSISVDTTLASGCYLANNGIRVEDSANLTLQAGVVIKFASGEQLFVESDASLTAEATSIDPIVLSGQEPTPGYWDGVRFFFSNSIRNRLDHVQIEYAGGGAEDGNVVATSTSLSPTRLAISNSSLINGSGFGFKFEDGTLLDQFERNRVSNNNTAGELAPNAATALDSTSEYSGNTNDFIQLTTDDLTVDTTFEALDINYRAEDLRLEGNLTVRPGVTLEFTAGAELFVDSDGALNANGTAAEPILFTATESIPGFWNGIRFFFSPTVNNRLEHVVIEYGGGGFGDPSNTGNIRMTCTSISPSRLTIANTMSNFSLGWGLFLDDGCLVTEGENVSYSGNAVGAVNMQP